ncbi:hypothetical protein [Kitasatospora sp. Root107]|uniref:hypothetical protein n=1 Tax=Kitasatospora sp. Root107 TaxID=1736424 RepID=UPI00070F5AB1|nr:hypothetical protein [Kitasatospora sp. Root107]KQV11976.1 hypothetical protein ASC99_35445 [Kitasatospora sp. Root107]
MRTHLAAAVSAVALTTGMLVAAPPAGALTSTYPTSKFDVTFGNTYTRGTITWYDRSVNVAGENKSVDSANCRQTTAFTLDTKNKQLGYAVTPGIACGESETFSFSVGAPVPGGAAVVRICLDDGVKPLVCERYGR